MPTICLIALQQLCSSGKRKYLSESVLEVTCPKCGQWMDAETRRCPHCRIQVADYAALEKVFDRVQTQVWISLSVVILGLFMVVVIKNVFFLAVFGLALWFLMSRLKLWRLLRQRR